MSRQCIHGADKPAAAQQDATGVCPSTQATVLALKALLAGTGQALGDGARRLELALDDRKAHTVEIDADQAEVVKRIDLTAELKAGSHTLRLRPLAPTSATYQVVFRYHQPGDEPPPPLAIAVDYEQRKLRIRATLQVTATVTNRMPESAPMVMVELPIPAGFRVEATDFEAWSRPPPSRNTRCNRRECWSTCASYRPATRRRCPTGCARSWPATSTCRPGGSTSITIRRARDSVEASA